MRYPNISAERARRGLSQDELAQHLGVTRKTLYNWYQTGSIPPDKVELMSRLFDVAPEYLLEEGTVHERV